MTYYSIMFNNMKKNFKNYYIYIMSTVFSVLIFYLFNSIKYNKEMMAAVNSSGNVTAVFSATSYIVLLFSLIFIWYSNSFFVKKRKNEIALYSLLGLKKKKIGRMLFVENMIIAVIALVIGIAVGTLFSKLIVMLILRMLNEFVYVSFSFSIRAARDTVIFFLIIFLIASIHSYRLIYKVKLIELFASSRKKEKPFKTRPIFAIISLALVIYGYYLSQHMVNALFVINVFIVLGTVIAGTYGLFSYFLVFIVRMLKKRKKILYKGNNILAISNIAYRIKSHTVTFATIAILSASTIAALGMVDSAYYDFKTNEAENYPYTFTYKYIDEATNDKVLDIVNNSDKNELIGNMKIDRAKVSGMINYDFETKVAEWNLGSDQTFYTISNSTFNKMMDIREMDKQIKLKDDECVLNFSSVQLYDLHKLKGSTIDVNANDISAGKLTIQKLYKQSIVKNGYDPMYLVVSDNIYDKIIESGAETNSYYAVKVTDPLDSKELSDEIIKTVPADNGLTTYYYHFKDANEAYVTILFAVFFVGIIFLISTGSIIYFKLITEANDERDRYTILRKIGVSKKDITRSVKKQILLMFLLPLIVGLCHSGFALSAFNQVLNAHILTPVIVTMVGYSVIYLIYYFLTVNYYKKIILKK
ncbi:ABC transporter permease [Vallitalea longa]|uniref:ABC transporter permease n=1 Tax=Vallitalea longa TaxID=2936439 RepID=A0A9W5Y8G1_9FIRM|nr:ABC transporter permease [Vallitalea longa]GKX29110.1 ABC transporter permease [Vallitalea longa]